MSQSLVWENFEIFAKAALLACGTNSESELKHPSVALKMGYELARLVAAKMSFYSKRRDEQNRKEAKRFSYLLQTEWNVKVKRQAKVLLEERLFNKKVPDPQDIADLSKFLVCSLMNLELVADASTFRRVVVLTEARLTLYNRHAQNNWKPSCKIDLYKARAKGDNEVDLSLRLELTELEKKLLHSQEHVEVQEKNGKRVPLLLPVEVRRHLQYLTDSKVRSAAGIEEKNTYVFASSGQDPVRAGDALDIVKYEADLKYPNRILATNLRKHTATISQVVGLQDHELKRLTNHLGLSEKVHRATSGLLERLDIVKLMQLQEQNNVGKFAEVKLKDVQFQDLDPESETGAQAFRELDAEISVLEQGTDEADEVVVSRGRGKKKAKSVLRVKWTTEEENEINEYFKEFFIGKKTCPGMKDCLKAIKFKQSLWRAVGEKTLGNQSHGKEIAMN